MSQSSSTSSTVEGNTKSSTVKKKQVSPAKHWCFTLHNWNEKEVSSIKEIIKEKCKFAVFAKENGKSGDTPHLQGYIEFIVKDRPIGVFNNKRIRWEKRSIHATRKHNEVYIGKEDGEVWWWPEKYTCVIENFYGWQIPIINKLHEVPDDRSIHWIWGSKGCEGKTTLQKWIYQNFKDVVVMSGKCDDMKNGIIQYEKLHERLPKIVLVNIPRVAGGHVSIMGLEQIKDMFFFSGKYEGGMICGANPHVFIFANEAPELETMSPDRWNITCLDDLSKL